MKFTLGETSLDCYVVKYGDGPVPVIFTGPLAIYQHLFSKEFFSQFTVYSIGPFPWEKNKTSIVMADIKVSDVVELYHQLQQQIGQKVVWVGASALTLLALECARLYPEQTLGSVVFAAPFWKETESLFTFMGSTQQDFNEMLKAHPAKALAHKDNMATFAALAQKASIPVANFGFASDEGHAAERNAMAECIYANPTPQMRMQDKHWDTLDLGARVYAYMTVAATFDFKKLFEIRTPVLSIVGDKDGIVRPKSIPESGLKWSHHEILNCGHMAMHEAPEATQELLKHWLVENEIIARPPSLAF